MSECLTRCSVRSLRLLGRAKARPLTKRQAHIPHIGRTWYDIINLTMLSLLFAAAPAFASSLTGPQKNAVRSAQQYITVQGFSRNGLIEQLSSEYGDGYNVSDATAAVDSMDIDWNSQAVRSAEQYLSSQGFSCNGLIEQLSSSHGDKYTRSQAAHGAKQAGAC